MSSTMRFESARSRASAQSNARSVATATVTVSSLGEDGAYYSFGQNPRALEAARSREQGRLASAGGVGLFLRSNAAAGGGGGSAVLTAAPRFDLAGGDDGEPSPFGAVDTKVTSALAVGRGRAESVSVLGPTTAGGSLAPFDWSKYADLGEGKWGGELGLGKQVCASSQQVLDRDGASIEQDARQSAGSASGRCELSDDWDKDGRPDWAVY